MATQRVRDVARECPLVLFGVSVARALDEMDALAVVRDVDVVELWSGVEAVTRAARQRHFHAISFDIARVPGLTDVDGAGSEDITTEFGFRKALSLVARIRSAGLLVEAPVCSSFVFPNSSNTKRKHDNIAGDIMYPPVQLGNLMANIAAFLLVVAIARGVHGVLENPAGSLMFAFLEPVLCNFSFLHTGRGAGKERVHTMEHSPRQHVCSICRERLGVQAWRTAARTPSKPWGPESRSRTSSWPPGNGSAWRCGSATALKENTNI